MRRDILSYFGVEKNFFQDIIVHETSVSRILVKSRIYGVDYAINPYIGCAHSCVYCYARYIFERWGIDPILWGKIVYVKKNAPQILRSEIDSAKMGLVLLSSVTDAYQFIEEKYKITRQLIEILAEKQFSIVILTKSDLVLRDIDLLKHAKVEIGFTITTMNDDIRKIFEPNAPAIEKRLKALEKLTNMGFQTYTFIGPVLPIFSERTISELIEAIHECGVKRIIVDKLNLKAKNWIFIDNALKESFPNLRKEFWKKAKSRDFYEKMRKQILELCSMYKLKVDFCY